MNKVQYVLLFFIGNKTTDEKIMMMQYNIIIYYELVCD